ncbi:hypothetical protein BDQ17DRAFT_749081 [Cyathus striatus]|nr:hypothetical protein BDQ17DRAFT_749081 [Cyathus striatus]
MRGLLLGLSRRMALGEFARQRATPQYPYYPASTPSPAVTGRTLERSYSSTDLFRGHHPHSNLTVLMEGGALVLRQMGPLSSGLFFLPVCFRLKGTGGRGRGGLLCPSFSLISLVTFTTENSPFAVELITYVGTVSFKTVNSSCSTFEAQDTRTV